MPMISPNDLPDEEYLAVSIEIDPVWIEAMGDGDFRTGLNIWNEQFELNEDDWGASSDVTETDIPIKCVAQYWTHDEDGIEETVGAKHSQTEIPGRAEAYVTYMGAENRQISLNLNFQALHDDDPQRTQPVWDTEYWSPQSVVFWGRWLERLKLPVYNRRTQLSHGAPPLIITIGNLHQSRARADQVSLTWIGPFAPKTMLPYGARCACTFTVVRVPYGTEDYDGNEDVPAWNKFLRLPGAPPPTP